MYLDLFGLKELPFRLSPDPQFLYLSRNHSRAKAYMESTIWFTDGFVVITGEIGAGKTTLIESFLKELDKDVVVAQVNQTQVSAIEFLQSVLVQFGFTPFRMKKAELLATLNNFLIEQYAAGRKVLLIIDEAQNLSQRVLEEIRLLSGVETTKEKVLRIILAGQPELNDKLDAPELVQLVQRVRLRFHLTALTREDMEGYVRHRLDVAGANGREIFAPDTFAEIYRYSGGTPRLINTLCDTAMMAAYGADRDHVTKEDIASAVEELQWVEFSARSHTRVPPPVDRHAATARLNDSAIQPAPFVQPSAPPEPLPPLQAPPAGASGGSIVGRIVLASEGHTIAELPLRLGRAIVGRTSDNDLQIDSRFVSRHHCQIVSTASGTVIEDLNSTNGIYVRSRRVRRHTLSDGDVVTIGKHELRFVEERRDEARGFVDTLPNA